MPRSLRKLLLVTTAAGLLGACSELPSWATFDLSRSPAVDPELTRAANVVSMAERTRREGDFKSAADLYAVAIERMPKDVALHVRRAFVLLDAGKPVDAENGFRQALALQPNQPDAMRGLGNALLAQDRNEDAAAQFKLAMATAVKTKIDYRLYAGLGVALDLKGDHPAAQAAYRVGLKNNPESLSLANNLGLSLALAGKHKEAIAVLNKVVASDRATARHRQNLAMVYGLAGQGEQASRAVRNDVDPNAASAQLAYYNVLRAMRGWSPAQAQPTTVTRVDDPGLDTVPLSLSSRGISTSE